MKALLCSILLLASSAFSAEWNDHQLQDRVQSEIKSVSPNIGRVEFTSVSLADLRAWRLGMESKFSKQDGWRCTTFADALYFYSKYMNHRAAVGVIWFFIHPDEKNHIAHAVNVFLDKENKLRFYDPMTQLECHLTARQIESIYYVLF